MKTSILALLLTSSLAIASVQTQVSKCSGSASCGGSQSNKQNFSGGKLKRDIASLFRRSDPEFDFAMHILERNAEAADRSIDEIAANILAGKVHPDIEAAAKTAGLYTEKVTHQKRDTIEARAPPAGKHDTTKVAQHLLSGGPVPPKILAAIKQSKHYLAPGQNRNNPTGKPSKGAVGGATGGVAGGSRGGSRKGSKPRDLSMHSFSERDLESLYERELSDSLYERDHYDQGLYERDLYNQGLYERDLLDERDLYEQGLYERDLLDERDLYEQGLYERDLLDERDLITRAIFERDPEAEVTYDQITDLAAAVQSNPHAGHAVYHALTMDPNVEKVTEKLVADWVTSANQKRDTEAYEAAYLQARDAYAEAEAEADAEAEAYGEYHAFQGFESY